MRRKDYKPRLFVILIAFIAILSFYVTKIVYIQFYKSAYLSKLAQGQQGLVLQLEPERGDIFDRNMNELAVDRRVYSVYATPRSIEDKEKQRIARVLSPLLDMESGEILSRLNQDRYFAWIKREVEKETSDAVEEKGLNGIGFAKERKRFYPKGAFACHIIGFAGTDDTGLEGIELFYDSYLKGSPGWRWTVKDAKRRDIVSKDEKFIPPKDGLNVILTVDEAVQHIAETQLDSIVEKFRPKGASIIIMDPASGDILALANRPAFELNKLSSAALDDKRNRAVTDIYEPGSAFKIVTASCALENNAVGMDQKFFCENGAYRVGGRILHDHTPHGTLTFKEVIVLSSNIGVTKIAQIMGKDEIYRFIRLFGFGERTNIDIPGEVVGIVRPPREWSGVSISAVPIGQEIAVTSIQLVSAICAIANGGYLVKPRLVKEIRDPSGSLIKEFKPSCKKTILSEETVIKMKEILKGVVEDGTGKAARLDGYTTAGKTGTGQKLEPDGRYSHTKFVASFIGFAPVGDPKVAILVTVDEPQSSYYGGSVAAPAFKNAARDVLRYLKVEPDKPGEKAEL